MHRKNRSYHSYRGLALWVGVILAVTLSCDLTGTSSDSAQKTIAALSIEQTVIAQQSGQDIQATSQAEAATRVAMEVQATMLAVQASQPTPQPVEETQPPLPTVSEAPPETLPPPAQVDEATIKAAKILLFEDMSGHRTEFDVVPKFRGIYPTRYVKEALDMGGYAYIDVGSAQGWLKDQLFSSTQWDLIIVSSEARTRIQGEYFVYLLEHLNRGTAVILELWNMDELSEGKIAPILAKCGVEFEDDWSGNRELALWPLIPEHPIFHEPNSGISLRNYEAFWWPDHGDLMRLSGSGDAQLLLGTIATQKSDHGTMVMCMGGRLVIQTYCDHDFAQEEIVPLWENVIFNVLRNKLSSSLSN